jgi:hypothetical protein
MAPVSEPSIREERKVVTALFADLVGSTALAERLDPEEVRLVVGEAVAERAAVIPLAYGRSMAFVKPWVQGWWEFGKACSSFADLEVDSASPRAR